MSRCRDGTGGLCSFHPNPNKAVELGRIGGRKNGHAHSTAATSLPALETAGAMQEAMGRLIEDLHSGKLQSGHWPRILIESATPGS
jgi:hypothetical protein